jgi:hypothetical protein
MLSFPIDPARILPPQWFILLESSYNPRAVYPVRVFPCGFSGYPPFDGLS